MAGLLSAARPRPACGFTLPEMLLAVSLAALLASLALPSLGEALIRVRRAEAVTALGALQLAQENRRAQVAAYTTDLAALGLAQAVTASGAYLLSVQEASEHGYTLLASRAPQARGPADERCAVLALRAIGGRLTLASACAGCELPAAEAAAADPHRCWASP